MSLDTAMVHVGCALLVGAVRRASAYVGAKMVIGTPMKSVSAIVAFLLPINTLKPKPIPCARKYIGDDFTIKHTTTDLSPQTSSSSQEFL